MTRLLFALAALLFDLAAMALVALARRFRLASLWASDKAGRGS